MIFRWMAVSPQPGLSLGNFFGSFPFVPPTSPVTDHVPEIVNHYVKIKNMALSSGGGGGGDGGANYMLPLSCGGGAQKEKIQFFL